MTIVITEEIRNTKTGKRYRVHTNFEVDINGLYEEISGLPGIDWYGDTTRYSGCVIIGKAFDNQSETILQNVKSVLIERCI